MFRTVRTFRRRLQTIAALLFVALMAAKTASAAQTGFLSRTFKDANGASHEYMVYVPPNYSPAKKWPVMLFLHGAGERGSDGLRQTVVGLGPMIRRRKQPYPFIVVFPQCERRPGRLLTSWNADLPAAQRALKILDSIEREYSVDTNRRVLTGWSMGGFGVWNIAAATPKHWSAVVPLAGGGDPALAKRLTGVPMWAFHGEDDNIVPIARSREMIAALRSAGGNPTFTVVKDIGHGVWKTAYDFQPLLQWMLDPTKPPTNAPAELIATDTQRAIATDEDLIPFKPAVEISQVAAVRLGNDALNAFSYSVPDLVPRDMLVGRLGDIYDSSEAEGITFSVRFYGISYAANLSRVRITGIGRDRLRVQLGLSNATMQIGGTAMSGRNRSASTGPINIVVGHREPVWLTIDVQPYIVNRRLKFKTLSKSFEIPNDNWYVTQPGGVSVRGWGMTREKVSSGIVSGLYGNKARIEREVLSVVPKVVKELEKRLTMPDASDLFAGFWPLPVYPPRLKIWPESVRVDDSGATLTFGLTAAAIDPDHAPRQPRRITASAKWPDDLQNGKQLLVGLAPGALGSLTQLLVDADLARINVLDIPTPGFAKFVDRKEMTDVFPDLKRFGPDVQLSAELILRKPMTVVPESQSPLMQKTESNAGKQAATNRPTFQLTEGTIAIAIKTEKSSGWKPYAELSVRLAQPLSVNLQKRGFTRRLINVAWSEKPVIAVDGRFAGDAQPLNDKIDTASAERLFRGAWREWMHGGAKLGSSIPLVSFGISALRAEKLEWNAPYIVAMLRSPGLKISNKSDQPLTYEIKGPYSKWGGPYTIKPDGSHEFDVPYSVLFRRKVDGKEQLYTLPAGSHSEFRKPVTGGAPRLFKAE